MQIYELHFNEKSKNNRFLSGAGYACYYKKALRRLVSKGAVDETDGPTEIQLRTTLAI